MSANYYNPTPEEIAASCRQIQAEWDESEFRRRAGQSSAGRGWAPPIMRLLRRVGREFTDLSTDALYIGCDPEKRLS